MIVVVWFEQLWVVVRKDKFYDSSCKKRSYNYS